ncbi:MAG: hypothetical protein JRE61_15130, partial [Deltaproteobacteria bacterium]|nr:hypothetical protein [Deltaproteobacteria bacterium]
ETGKAAEAATALDALADAEKRVRQTQKAAEEAKASATSLKEKLSRLESGTDKNGINKSKREELKASLTEAEEQAKKTTRRAAKAKAKAETASKAVENLGIQPSKSDKEIDGALDSENK